MARARAAFGLARPAAAAVPPDPDAARTRLLEALAILHEAQFPPLEAEIRAALAEAEAAAGG